LIPAALLMRGVKAHELSQIMGGNFMRVFEQNQI
jgi:microsomal dipeptidase-like Zn-dependent dipeptidase